MNIYFCSSRREEAHSKILFNARPHPNPLPRGDGTAVGYFIFIGVFLTANNARFAKWRQAVLPLLGERAGVKEVVISNP